MSTARGDKVEIAIRRIRRVHRRGTILRARVARRNTRTTGRGAAEPHRRLSVEYARKSRQFADPMLGYTSKELAEVYRLMRRASPDAGHVIGVFHVWRLMTVLPKGDRRKLQTRLVREGWSIRRLDREIATRIGHSGHGGRRRMLPDDRGGRLAVLERECDRWRRLRSAFDRVRGGDRKSRVGAPILTLVGEATAAIEQLRLAVAAALKRANPRRAAPDLRSRRPTATPARRALSLK